jgi:hypothetical protein
MKIISGAQTGADQGGLEAAESLGLPTGGFCPKQCITETGPRPELIKRFSLIELNSEQYSYRTWENVRKGDITFIFGDLTGGSKQTKEYCERLLKPWHHIPFEKSSHIIPGRLIKFIIKTHHPEIINIAGNRESKSPGIQNWTREVLKLSLKGL